MEGYGFAMTLAIVLMFSNKVLKLLIGIKEITNDDDSFMQTYLDKKYGSKK